MQPRSESENARTGSVPCSEPLRSASKDTEAESSSLKKTREFLERIDSLFHQNTSGQKTRGGETPGRPSLEDLRARRVARLPWPASPKKLQEAISAMLREEVRDRDESFSSVEHLSAEAVAGYVDGELSLKAQKRARAHLLHCSICRREVREQKEASQTLRQETESDIHVPSALVSKLANLNPDTCAEGPAAGDILQPDTLFGRLNSIYWAARRTYKDRTN